MENVLPVKRKIAGAVRTAGTKYARMAELLLFDPITYYVSETVVYSLTLFRYVHVFDSVYRYAWLTILIISLTFYHCFLSFEGIDKDLTEGMHDACKFEWSLKKCVHNFIL